MIITRTILNMSYTVIETYINKNPKTLEFQLVYKDSDKNENISYTEHISNLSFSNTIYFQYLVYQYKFSVRSVREKTIKDVFDELDNICLTVKNHQFELTKILDLEFCSDFEKKIIESFKLSNDRCNRKIESICNKYCSPYYYSYRAIDITINYYKIKFQRKSKLLKLENYINEN